MSFTLTIPTWKQITNMFFLVVAYYATLVEPQYDWWVFGVTYYLGTLIALRSFYRGKEASEKQEGRELDDHYHFAVWFILTIICLTWVLWPIFRISSLIVTFGNKKGTK